jgi:hypothetical protein
MTPPTFVGPKADYCIIDGSPARRGFAQKKDAKASANFCAFGFRREFAPHKVGFIKAPIPHPCGVIGILASCGPVGQGFLTTSD